MPIKNAAIKNFYELGEVHIAAKKAAGKDPCYAVRMWDDDNRITPEWSAWEHYFHWLGCEPAQMKMVRRGELKTMTMPDQWPIWFDVEWRTKKDEVPEPVHAARPLPSPEERQAYIDRLTAKLGKGFGLGGKAGGKWPGESREDEAKARKASMLKQFELGNEAALRKEFEDAGLPVPPEGSLEASPMLLRALEAKKQEAA